MATLGVAALGATRIFSCDIHADALITARTHVKTPLFVGSADGIKDGVADLTLSNISAAALDRIAWDLQRITKPNGLLIISGFIHENPPKHFVPREVLSKGDWLCWICEPKDVKGAQQHPAACPHPQQWWL